MVLRWYTWSQLILKITLRGEYCNSTFYRWENWGTKILSSLRISNFFVPLLCTTGKNPPIYDISIKHICIQRCWNAKKKKMSHKEIHKQFLQDPKYTKCWKQDLNLGTLVLVLVYAYYPGKSINSAPFQLSKLLQF